LSHLWASVAQESARSTPATSGRSRGLAAAHIPKAPSTCTQAPRAWATWQISPTGSSAPELTLPSWAHTIAGPLPRSRAAAGAAGRRRPWSSASTASTAPAPRNRSARSMVPWRPWPASTRTRGAPHSPSDSTSQPARSSSSRRAMASPVKLAICPPATSPTETPAGRPSSSASQAPATSSTTLAAGPSTYRAAFWSQAEVSQSAARAAGVAPPTTNPKYRPPAVATTPGSAAVASSATTSRGSSGRSGSGPPRAARSSARPARPGTGRPGRPSR